MKSFTIYRDIRMKALIFGLPIGSFAVLMTSIIASLLLIIFSFGLIAFVLAVCWNIALYIGLLNSGPVINQAMKKSLRSVSNKQIFDHEY